MDSLGSDGRYKLDGRLGSSEESSWQGKSQQSAQSSRL
jgi:hypothetical protein